MKREIIFLLSVDTEEEWDWSGPLPENDFSTENGRNIPKFQEFCGRLGVRPTYFVDYAIADDPVCVQNLKKLLSQNKCEVGAHLHPWCTPPVLEEISDHNSYINNLPMGLLRDKLKNLGCKIQDEFAVKPTSFRAGRWGINGSILKMLAGLGYYVDSSIHPYYEDTYFSYKEAPDKPYWPDFYKCTEHGEQHQLFEIPVSSGFNCHNFQRGQKLDDLLSSFPFRLLRMAGIMMRLKIFYKVVLSPEFANSAQMIALTKACLRRGHRILHMFFHSSSLLPGGSPYVQTKDDEKVLYHRMESVVEFLKNHYDIQFCTITEARKLYLRENFNK